MSEPANAPAPYQVAYSGLARGAIPPLVTRARAAGGGAEVLAALKELDRRLRIYPQFGEPLVDLTHESGQIWMGTVPPLVVRYSLYEERRLVIVVVPIAPMPASGI